MTDDGTLCCGHCGSFFEPTKSQRKHAKYEGLKAYCSVICRTAAQAAQKRKTKPDYGPCPTCGAMFQSRVPKRFCSLKCYTASDQMREMLAANRAVATPMKRQTTVCLECGVEFEAKVSSARKFCSHRHYRDYMAKRFDRWIASPQTLALPQAYDEFLAANELECLVDGCNWRGQWLTMHMNFAHGVPADAFKRAAGFNLTSGIIGRQLQEAMSDRPQSVGNPALAEIVRSLDSHQPEVCEYRSLEGREHAAKAYAIATATRIGPHRKCLGCGNHFQQPCVYGRKIFCSIDCRDKHYASIKSSKKQSLICVVCSKEFFGTLAQQRRSDRGLPVCCGPICRGTLNGAKPKPKARRRTH